MPDPFHFEASYAALPDRFHATVHPTPVSAPQLVALNTDLARFLGFDPDSLHSPQGVALLAGNHIPPHARPVALAYAGHQFGHFVPQLGDGRALLLGERFGADGRLYDIQLKGSGPTPFSRQGDGRAPLGPVLREYLISEAMAALGVPTTRSLAVVTSGDLVQRETDLPGAVLTRVAASHIRVGTFQYFAARGDKNGIRILADHTIARHYPACAEAANPYRALLDTVITKSAELIAHWMSLGFIHGVMNTDNMAISGETIDYGPCAFMDHYDPTMSFSAIDHYGRYAFRNQPSIAHWNLARLAESLLELLSEDHDQAVASARAALAGFATSFDRAYNTLMAAKLGITGDAESLATNLLDIMQENQADFTLSFRWLSDAAEGDDRAFRALFADQSRITHWLAQWRHHGPTNARHINPAIIPRNHLVQQAIDAAVTWDDFKAFEELRLALTQPFATRTDRFAQIPLANERVHRTFCGT